MMKNPHPAKRRVMILLGVFAAFLLLFGAVLLFLLILLILALLRRKKKKEKITFKKQPTVRVGRLVVFYIIVFNTKASRLPRRRLRLYPF